MLSEYKVNDHLKLGLASMIQKKSFGLFGLDLIRSRQSPNPNK